MSLVTHGCQSPQEAASTVDVPGAETQVDGNGTVDAAQDGVMQPPLGAVPAAVLDRLAASEAQRRTERAQRREAAEAAANPHENVQAFLQSFSSRQQAAQQQLSSLQPCTSSSGAQGAQATEAALDALAAEMATQEQRLAEASYYLPGFDLRSCTTQVLDFKASIESARATLLPKKKFAFSKKVSRVKGADIQATAPAAGGAGAEAAASSFAAAGAAATERDLQLVAAGRGLAGLRNQVVVRHMDQPPGADFVVMDCVGCTLYLLGHLGALRLLQLEQCTVVAGPVTGATFMDGLQSCTLVLASYQIRIHRAISTDLYLRVRSRPIIEHSTGLRFAPYNLQHEPTRALLQTHNLHEDNGMHGSVDDFGWIKAVQSPNWSLLPADQCQPVLTVPEDIQTLTDAVPGTRSAPSCC